MADKRRVYFTHYDLDGVGCDILLSKLIKFEKKYCGGYSKLRERFINGDFKWYDSCIISDISLTPEQFKELSDEYGNKFMYIDHHDTSKEAIEAYNTDSQVFFTNTLSGTGITFKKFYEHLKGFNGVFVQAIDAYDMWRHKTHPDLFRLGYNLNTLFWKYGYNDFYDRFSNNMSLKFTDQEIKWIDEHNSKREESLEQSEKHDVTFDSVLHSMLVVDADKHYVNDYTLQYLDYDMFYIMTIDTNGNLSLSLRYTRDDNDIHLGSFARVLKSSYSEIITAGGHAVTAGMDIKSDIDYNILLDIVQDFDRMVVDKITEADYDVPF